MARSLSRNGHLLPAPGSLIQIAILVFSVAIVALYSYGTLTLPLTLAILATPVLIVAAADATRLVLLLVAVPPGLILSTPGVSVRILSVLLVGALVMQGVLHGRLHFGLKSGAAPLLLLIAMTVVHRADLSFGASQAAVGFFDSLIYYVLLMLVTYNATRYARLAARHLIVAIIIGVVGTALAFVVQTFVAGGGVNLQDPSSIPNPGLLFHRTHFGYLVAIGFCLTFAQLIQHSRDQAILRSRPLLTALSGFLLVVTALSQTRGAWLAVAITVLVVAWLNDRRGYWLIVPLALLLLLIIPVGKERLLSDVTSGLGNAIASGELATGRVALWRPLWDHSTSALPWGNGFGHMWTLTSEELFGFSGQFVTPGNTFVYPHNDFLFWFLELGVVGVGLVIVFWTDLLRKIVLLLRSSAEHNRRTVMVLMTIPITMLVAELVDNGIFIRAIAERFFVVAGFVFAMGALALGSQDARMDSKRTPKEGVHV